MEIGIVMGLMKYEGRMGRWLDCKGNELENGASKVIIHVSEEI